LRHSKNTCKNIGKTRTAYGLKRNLKSQALDYSLLSVEVTSPGYANHKPDMVTPIQRSRSARAARRGCDVIDAGE